MVATTSFSGAIKYELCHLRSRDNYLERPQRIASEAVIMHKWTHRRSNRNCIVDALCSIVDTLCNMIAALCDKIASPMQPYAGPVHR